MRIRWLTERDIQKVVFHRFWFVHYELEEFFSFTVNVQLTDIRSVLFSTVVNNNVSDFIEPNNVSVFLTKRKMLQLN